MTTYDMAYIEKHSTPEPNTGCWLWTRRAHESGKFGEVGRTKKSSHRIAYEQAFGDVPKSHFVTHTCGQGTCCNPRHLRLKAKSEVIKHQWAEGQFKRTKKEFCLRGHPKTGRDCQECARIRRNLKAGRPEDWCSDAGFQGLGVIKRRVYVDKSGCWRWKGVLSGKGYGHGKFRNTTAARVAFEAAGGVLLKGERVWHKCGITACCNPEHMGVATQSQIVKKLWKEGRFK